MQRIGTQGLVFSLIGLLWLGVFSCASVGNSPLLETRVQMYVQALNANDGETLYAMTAPSYRSEVSLGSFLARRNIGYTDVSVREIKKMSEDASQATATLAGSMHALGFAFEGREFKTNWVVEDNEWYVLPSTKSFKETFSQTSE